jgi:hypothetical protein
MNVAAAGNPISGVEVVNVSPQGFCLLLGGKELVVSFSSFPWFRGATIAQITNVELLSAQHLYWPDLDIDLSVESIRDPGAFPLVSNKGL